MDQSLSELLSEFSILEIGQPLLSEGISTVTSLSALKANEEKLEDLCARLSISGESKENLMKAVDKASSSKVSSDKILEDALHLVDKMIKTRADTFKMENGESVSKRDVLVRIIRSCTNPQAVVLAKCALGRIMKKAEKIVLVEGEEPKDRAQICKEAFEADRKSPVALASYIHVLDPQESEITIDGQTMLKSTVFVDAMDEWNPQSAIFYHDMAYYAAEIDTRDEGVNDRRYFIGGPEDPNRRIIHARELYAKAIGFDPEVAENYTHGAQICWPGDFYSPEPKIELADGRKLSAIEALCIAIQKDPNHWQAYSVLSKKMVDFKVDKCTLLDGREVGQLELCTELIRCGPEDALSAFWQAAKLMKYGDTIKISDERTLSSLDMWHEVLCLLALRPAEETWVHDEVWQSAGNCALNDAPEGAVLKVSDGRALTQNELKAEIVLHCSRENEKLDWLLRLANTMKKDEVVAFGDGKRLTRLQVLAGVIGKLGLPTDYHPNHEVYGFVARELKQVQPEDVLELHDGRKMTYKDMFVAAIALDPKCNGVWTVHWYKDLRDMLGQGETIRMFDGKDWTWDDFEREVARVEKRDSRDTRPTGGCVCM